MNTSTYTQIDIITKTMNRLEIEIARQQSHIAKWGEKNDAGEHDEQWEQYKTDAAYNLSKWDSLKTQRNKLITTK